MHFRGVQPPVVQRESPQPSGLRPSPLSNPQLKRLDGLPFSLLLQSAAQLTPFSPLPASQMPLPQTAPEAVPEAQSFAQLLQSSPASQIPSLSQVTTQAGSPLQSESAQSKSPSQSSGKGESS
jgi:hypothetical protein